MCKILIIEEDMQRRRLYTEALQREGYQIIAVHSGEQALEVFDYTTVDLALVNLLLANGMGLNYAVEMVSRRHDLKVVASAANEKLKKEFRSWAIDYFLSDPAGLTELKEVIAGILQKPKTPWRQNQLKFAAQKNSPAKTPEENFRQCAYSNYLAGYLAAGGAPGGEMGNWLDDNRQPFQTREREERCA